MTNKETLFIKAYLASGSKTFLNATQAAIKAGYSAKTAYSIGSENLRKPEVSEQIKGGLDAILMSKEEALSLLADHARGDVNAFLDKDGCFDLAKARRAKKTRLIKKLKVKTVNTFNVMNDNPVREEEKTVEFELYDAQAAATTILKSHGGLLESQKALLKVGVDEEGKTIQIVCHLGGGGQVAAEATDEAVND